MNTSQQSNSINPDDAAAALAENRRLEAQTVAEGASPWPPSAVLPVVLALPPLAYLIDLDMVWLFAALVGTMAAFTVTRRVQLRPERRSMRWDLILAGTMLVALAANIGVQFLVRGAEIAAPNAWGMAATSIVIVNLTWPVQRYAAKRIAA